MMMHYSKIITEIALICREFLPGYQCFVLLSDFHDYVLVIADESMTKQICTVTQKYKLWYNCFYLCKNCVGFGI